MQELDRHRLAVGEAEALDREHRLGRRDVQDAAEPRAGRDRPELERAAARREPALAHVVAERGDRHPLRDLRLGDERARAAAAREVALADELVERRADGQPRDAEVDAELPLGRDRVADVERSISSSTCSRVSRCFVTMARRRAPSRRLGRRAGRRPVAIEEVEAARVDRRARRSPPTRDARAGVDAGREERPAVDQACPVV